MLIISRIYSANFKLILQLITSSSFQKYMYNVQDTEKNKNNEVNNIKLIMIDVWWYIYGLSEIEVDK